MGTFGCHRFCGDGSFAVILRLLRLLLGDNCCSFDRWQEDPRQRRSGGKSNRHSARLRVVAMPELDVHILPRSMNRVDLSTSSPETHLVMSRRPDADDRDKHHEGAPVPGDAFKREGDERANDPARVSQPTGCRPCDGNVSGQKRWNSESDPMKSTPVPRIVFGWSSPPLIRPINESPAKP